MTTEDPIFLLVAFTEMGASDRTFGFYHTEEEARDAVERNRGGMNESRYHYLVIEKVWPGVHGESEVVDWFEWVEPVAGHTGDAPWVWCNAPEWSRGLVSLGGVG